MASPRLSSRRLLRLSLHCQRGIRCWNYGRTRRIQASRSTCRVDAIQGNSPRSFSGIEIRQKEKRSVTTILYFAARICQSKGEMRPRQNPWLKRISNSVGEADCQKAVEIL